MFFLPGFLKSKGEIFLCSGTERLGDTSASNTMGYSCMHEVECFVKRQCCIGVLLDIAGWRGGCDMFSQYHCGFEDW